MSTDPLAAWIAAAKLDIEGPHPRPLVAIAARQSALVAALEAVLARHVPGRVMIMGSLCAKHEAHRHFSISITEANDVRDCPDCGAAVLTTCTGCGAVYGHCPDLRAIRRELLVDDVDAALLGQEAADHD